jgi:hypothetical protein
VRSHTDVPASGDENDGGASYDLPRPDLTETREAIHQLYGPNGPQMWHTVIARAGLTGTETDPGSLDRLLTAMVEHDPVTALCAHGIRLRIETHTRLRAVHALIRAAE